MWTRIEYFPVWWFSFSSLAAMGRRRPSAYRNDCVARRLFPPIYEHPGATVYSSRPHLYISYIHLFSFSSFCFFFLTFEKGKEDFFFYCWFYFLKKTKGRSELDLCTQASKCCCNTFEVPVDPGGWNTTESETKWAAEEFVQGWCHQRERSSRS